MAGCAAASADCSPSNTGTSGQDAITCDSSSNPAGANVSGGGANDTITIRDGATAGQVSGDGGDDTINLKGGSATSILGSNGMDEINLLGGTAGSVGGGTGTDTITLKGATVSGAITGDGAADTINLKSGSAASVSGGDGDDEITLDGATIAGAITGDAGEDKISLNPGSAGSVDGGDDNDSIFLKGATISGTIDGGDGDDLIKLNSAADMPGTGSAAAVYGGIGNDTILLGGATISGVISGDAGADTITLDGGEAGSVSGGDDGDTVTLEGATIDGAITGDQGNDRIYLTSGTAGSVDGGTGYDTITLEGAAISGTLAGGDADDTIKLLAGSAGDVDGGSGADGITLDGATVSGAIHGRSGIDTVDLISGEAGAVYGDAGNDIINLEGAAIDGVIDGGGDDDMITLTSGSAGSIAGGDGDDTIDWQSADATVTGIDGGNGSDDISIDVASIDLTGVVLDGGDDSAAADTYVDILHLDSAWSGTLLGANVRDFEKIIINGGTVGFSDGTLTAGSGGGLGLFVDDGGTLDASEGLALTGDLTVAANGTVAAGNDGTNTVTVSGDFANDGTIDLQGTGHGAGDRLSVSGDYVGATGSELREDIDLQNGIADRLDISGTSSGTTTLEFNVVASGGINDDIAVVSAADGSSATITGGDLPAARGLARYSLVQASDGDWVVRSALDGTVAASTIAAVPQVLSAAMQLFDASAATPSMPSAERDSGCAAAGWARGGGVSATVGFTGAYTGDGAGGPLSAASHLSERGFEAGWDCGVDSRDRPFGDMHVGFSAGVVDGDATARDRPGSAVDFNAQYVGVYGRAALDALDMALSYRHTFYGVDLIDSEVFGSDGGHSSGSANTLRGDVSFTRAFGALRLSTDATLTYSGTQLGSYATSAGPVTVGDVANLLAGIRFGADWTLPNSGGGYLQPFASIAFFQDLMGAANSTLHAGVGDMDLETDAMGPVAQAGVGLAYGTTDSAAQAFIRADTIFGGSASGIAVNGGFRVLLAAH